MIGANGVNISQKLPDYNANYILTYLSATYGIIAGIVCMCFIYDFKHVRQYLRLLIEWIKFRIHPCHSAGRCFYHLFPLLFRKMKKEQ